jgi:transcriptional regulator of acetoin/glycerol metabolism
VRELRNAIEYALVVAEPSTRLEGRDLPNEIARGDSAVVGGLAVGLPLAEVERRCALAALEHCEGARTRAAKTLGIGANTLWRKLRRREEER